ncbi:hypothetical protein M9458_023753, partial [Cirrhinus mrigala]
PKPKEAQRSILRPPVLQPPMARSPPQNSEYKGTETHCGAVFKNILKDKKKFLQK